jgi:putative nucleotidyltransferase with HDIG domain
MFRFLRKKRLEARGLSCGKSRLAAPERIMVRELEKGILLRSAIVMVAAGVLMLFCLAGDPTDPFKHLLYALLILALGVIQPVISGDSGLKKNSRLALFLGVILLQVGIGEFLQRQVFNGRLDGDLLPLLLPYALAPLTLSVLMGPQIGLAGCLVGALWWSVLHVTRDPVLLLLAITGGLVSVLATLRVRRRSRVLRGGFYSGLSVMLFVILLGVISILSDSSGPFVWNQMLIGALQQLLLHSLSPLGIGLLTAVVVSGSLPLLERCFGITTEISWLEMADLNHPLLRRLSLEAPGTYHHSLAMANLAEACAEKVGANATLCRVSAYFHDIGKLSKPEYFTENAPSDYNPHDELTPTMSALVILSHVKDGVDLGLRNKLNSQVIDSIREHHGTTLVEYFYRRACRQEQDAREGGSLLKIRPEDIPKVSEENYRYPGPKPQTIEAVILGLADAAESASRSLERPTVQRIDDLVHDILQDRIADGQYDEAPVTLLQLHAIAETLVSSLSSMLHSRISYRKKDGEREGTGESAEQ